jgi:hypothetical protein
MFKVVLHPISAACTKLGSAERNPQEAQVAHLIYEPRLRRMSARKSPQDLTVSKG